MSEELDIRPTALADWLVVAGAASSGNVRTRYLAIIGQLRRLAAIDSVNGHHGRVELRDEAAGLIKSRTTIRVRK